MDQSQTVTLFGGRYELINEGEHGSVEVIDREPWRHCWSCGSTDNEPDESFCTNCGADLRNRSYRGFLSSARQGPALIPLIKDETARALLPDVWDQVKEGNETLIVLKPDNATSPQLPLDELVAMRIGLALGHLLSVLHSQNLELGTLVPNDLGLNANGQPKLLNIDDLCYIDDSDSTDSVREDLLSLAGLLESLTNTPRMTQRLDEGAPFEPAPPDDKEADLSMVLREIRTSEIKTASALEARLEALIAERTRPTSLNQMVGARTDTGMVRDHNEDSLLAMKLGMNNTSLARTWGLYIVADGMGGHAGGEVASGLAIRSIADVIMREYLSFALGPDATYDDQWTQDIVRQAVLQANETVRLEAQQRSNDMGTTLTMALIVGDRATIANIGDSRTYLYRDGKLRRISKDHSLVMRLVELGQITDNDIYTHPQRNAVLRSLGDRPGIEVDIFTERLQPGDGMLLCSDGQWEMTHDAEMERMIAMYEDPEVLCQELIQAANHAGGEDNVTSVFVRFASL